jgi:hypothetical protein
LACLGIFAENPKAAKHSRLGQVTPSHAKSRVIFLMWDRVNIESWEIFRDFISASMPCR